MILSVLSMSVIGFQKKFGVGGRGELHQIYRCKKLCNAVEREHGIEKRVMLRGMSVITVKRW